MPHPFARTTRAQSADSGTLALLLTGASVVILACLGLWGVTADVPLYEVSADARVVSRSGAHALVAQTDGRVLGPLPALGEVLHEGEVVLTLDQASERFGAEGARAKQAWAQAELAAVAERLAAIERAAKQQAARDSAALLQAEAELRRAESGHALAAKEADRARALFARHVIAGIEHDRAVETEENARLAVDAARAALSRLRAEHAMEAASRAEREAELVQTRASLEGALQEARIAENRADTLSATYTVRAPVSGHISEVRPVTAGAWLQAGDTVALLLPNEGGDSQLRAEARFAASATGRVRPGQQAYLRLDGYPWVLYGATRARVDSVSTSASGGSLRVLLEVDAASTRAPLAHDMPAAIEVEVGRTSPLALLLRRLSPQLDVTR